MVRASSATLVSIKSHCSSKSLLSSVWPASILSHRSWLYARSRVRERFWAVLWRRLGLRMRFFVTARQKWRNWISFAKGLPDRFAKDTGPYLLANILRLHVQPQPEIPGAEAMVEVGLDRGVVGP